MIKISIITPVMNNVYFIKQCLDSVIEQDCPNLEHLIIDGASDDGTLEIIKEYAEKHDHINWISEKDNGQSDAMNKGIGIAEGEIVTFLNVDDFFAKNVLEKVESRFRGLLEPTIIVGNCNILNGDENDLLLNVNRPSNYSFKNIFRYWRLDVFPGNPAAYFYHKSLHDKAGAYNVDDYYVLDYDFLYRAALHGNIVYFDEEWGNFRYYKGTKTEENVSKGTNIIGRRNVARRYVRYLSIFERFDYFLDELKWKISRKWSGFRNN